MNNKQIRHFSVTRIYKTDDIRDADETQLEPELVFKKAFLKEKLRRQALLNNHLERKIKFRHDETFEETLTKNRLNIIDEYNELSNDLGLAQAARKATIKLMNNEKPSHREMLCLKHIWKKYPTFFDDGVEGQEPDIVHQDMFDNSLNIEALTDYLKQEMYINRDRRITLKMWWKDLLDEKKELKQHEQSQQPDLIDYKGKRKLDDDCEEESSQKKSKTPTTDFIDALPVDYNSIDESSSE